MHDGSMVDVCDWSDFNFITRKKMFLWKFIKQKCFAKNAKIIDMVNLSTYGK